MCRDEGIPTYTFCTNLVGRGLRTPTIYKRGKMNLEEIRAFLSVQASFVGHIKHADSFNLLNKVGKIDEKNPFDFDRT